MNGNAKLLLTAVLFSLSSLVGCGGEGTVTMELHRLVNARGPAAPAVARASGVNVSSDLTIESLKVPIRSISLESSGSSGGGSTAYTCAADTNDGCFVDLAAAGALENLLTGAGATAVAEGSYGQVAISTCKSEGTYSALIKASGKTDPGGTGPVMYTQSTSGALSNSAGDFGAARVYFSGCTRRYPLPVAVEVKKDQPVKLKLYFDIRDIAFFGDSTVAGTGGSGNEAWFSGGYSFLYPASPGGSYVGVNYLDVAGTVDTGTPTIERYRVTAGTGGTVELGTFGLIFTSGGAFVGGFTRSFYSSATTQGHNRFVTPIQTYTDNGDSTYTIKNYGSSATGDGSFNTTSFVRATSGTARNFTDSTGAVAGTYTITALP